jgi:hypothetical protein
VVTSAGPLTSSRSAPSGELVVSIRPEAFRVTRGNNAGRDAPNSLHGRIVETSYLGELAQHIVELKPSNGAASPHPIRVKVAVLNPAPMGADAPAGDAHVTLSVEPDDVILVPAAELARTT